ncbi:NMT1/THI5 like domain protein [Beutenbergia cavernae DSM 12333]|uniref:Thiamine pyrimidine synthase n=1 Tax=Beutenbergia cavernae (strain ATCC BAA-8 / DSM 12333 / CCUG 43141 / JCM 11478 / NBRC 16432 / NCIMB 13614 / HKI 0122) TaxID=471853 RepID=C5BXD5_BEUC1|nr:ABC transporter substrate-binding protein [Beutenbergia cavernae]ACQ80818.1 NMT1/THI5 like domain protein [Beutenbergia cavernae DSM 12333]
MRRTHLTMGVSAVVGVTLLAACTTDGSGTGGEDPTSESGAEGEVTQVRLQLQWLTQGQFAGYFLAQENGYYADEGLEVEIVESGGDIVPQDALATGEVDYAIAWVPKVLGSIEQGADITNVAQVFQRSGTLQLSMADSGITSVDDFAGRSVGSWGFGNEWEIFAALDQAELTVEDIELVTQDFTMNAFLAGDIEAAQAMTYNEYAQVLETVNPDTGELYQPEDLNVIDYNDVGTAMLQDAIWADAGRLADDEEYRETTVAFLRASLRGWVDAREDPQAAADVVTAAGSQLGASHQLWMVNEVNKLIWPSPDGIGVADMAAWDATVDMAMATHNETGATIITAPPPDTAIDMQYVEQAVADLEADGVDVTGDAYEPIDVELVEGGN